MHKAKANFYISVIESANGNRKKVWQTFHKITGREKDKGTEPQLQLENHFVKDAAAGSREGEADKEAGCL